MSAGFPDGRVPVVLSTHAEELLAADAEAILRFLEREPDVRAVAATLLRTRRLRRHRAVVRAEGRDARGQGTASAVVTATLAPADGGTRVSLHTDLKITGRLAQFGRGVLAEVSNQLLGEFARALEADLKPGAASAEAAATSAATAGQPVDVLGAMGPSLLKRALPVILLLAAAFWLLRSC